MTMIKLTLSRHEVNDLVHYVIPLCLRMLDSTMITFKNSRAETSVRISKCLMEEMHFKLLQRDIELLKTKKPSIKWKLHEYHALVMQDLFIHLPMKAEELWRNEYRNRIISDLDRQIQNEIN